MSIFGSRAFGRKVIEKARASYWFWPTTLVLGALCLAEVVLWIDMHPGMNTSDLPAVLTMIDPDGARSILSTLATAVIGVAGVMFSMTLVAVSFAADTFGPRLIGNFMRDRGTQISFGLLLGTFVFHIVILRAVQGGDAAFVPYLGVAAALALTLMAVLTIIYYIHHVPETINVSNIASDLGRRFSGGIRSLIDARLQDNPDATAAHTGHAATGLRLQHVGYLQQLDEEALIAIACTHAWTIDVHFEPGDFMTAYDDALTVHGAQALSPAQEKQLRQSFATGDDRSAAQSTPFVADQLVEMIARALSPGFNDPFTAMNCLNWLHAGLMDALLYRGGLLPVCRHQVNLVPLDFPRLFAAAFAAAMPYTITDRMCRQRHLALTRDLLRHADGDNRKAIADLLPALRGRVDPVRP